MCQCLGGRDVKKRQINQRKWWRKSKQQENMDANLFIPNVCLTVWMWRTTFTVNSKWKENKRVNKHPRLRRTRPAESASTFDPSLPVCKMLLVQLPQQCFTFTGSLNCWAGAGTTLYKHECDCMNKRVANVSVLNLSVGFWGLSESLAW